MAKIIHEVPINGTQDKIYKALTEQEGLANWWTKYTTPKAEVGSVSEFKFWGGRAVFKMKITHL